MIARTLPHDLLARMLDQIVFDRVAAVDDPSGLPELEEDLIALLDEIRTPGDPPAKETAVHLIFSAIERCDGELFALERQLCRAQAGAS